MEANNPFVLCAPVNAEIAMEKSAAEENGELKNGSKYLSLWEQMRQSSIPKAQFRSSEDAY